MEEESGYSRNSIINWESGTRVPRADILAELAKLLNTTVGYLVGETDDCTFTERPAPEGVGGGLKKNDASSRENSPLLSLALMFEALKYQRYDMSKEEKAAVLSLLSACAHMIGEE